MAVIQKTKYMWIDGKLVDWDAGTVPFLTHTFQYGLGVFEGIRAYKTASGPAVLRLREHMKRLCESAHMVTMKMPYSVDELCDAAVTLIRENELDQCYLRPMAYYGDEEMGLGAINSVHVSIAAFYWGAYLGEDALKKGIRAKISSFSKPANTSMFLKGKITGAYVNSILAKREAKSGGYDEAILLDTKGYIAEASGENIFMIHNGELWTPPLSSSILAGITRDSILKIAQDEGIIVHEKEFTRDMLYVADECFLTGTAAEVTPVREVDDRTIGAGKMGPLTQKLQSIFFQAARGEDQKYASWLTPVKK